MKEKKKVIDLFCGCGGLSFGFLTAGYEILLGLDNDSASLETFKKNHTNSSVIQEDIERISDKEILKKTGGQKIDVIVGGPPCQGLSLSGPRKFHDPRNRLFLSFIRITDGLKPDAFVLENVPGLVGLFGGKVKDVIIDEFTKIGYKVKMKILIASDYGVPQLRKRVFFVGLRDHGGKYVFPDPSHYEKASDFTGENNKYITCEEAFSDLPEPQGSDDGSSLGYLSPPLNDYQKFMRKGSRSIRNHVITNHTERVKKIISLVPEGGNYKDLPDKYKNTRNFHVAWTRFHSKKPSPTVDTGHRHHFHYRENRVPTVRESARLQSFPDRFVFYGNKSQQYRHVGNAVPPFVAKAIAEELLKCL